MKQKHTHHHKHHQHTHVAHPPKKHPLGNYFVAFLIVVSLFALYAVWKDEINTLTGKVVYEFGLNSFTGDISAGNLGALRNLPPLNRNVPPKKQINETCTTSLECASTRCVSRKCVAAVAGVRLPGGAAGAGIAAAARRAQAPPPQQPARQPNPLAGLNVPAGLPENQPAPPPIPEPKMVIVSVTDNAFNPASVQIFTGDEVKWTNTGARAHQVVAVDNSFDSGVIPVNGAFKKLFDVPGQFGYTDPNTQLQGTLTVVQRPVAPPAPAQDAQRSPPLPGGLGAGAQQLAQRAQAAAQVAGVQAPPPAQPATAYKAMLGQSFLPASIVAYLREHRVEHPMPTCQGCSVVEFSCDANGLMKKSFSVCGQGKTCTDGACSDEAPQACADDVACVSNVAPQKSCVNGFCKAVGFRYQPCKPDNMCQAGLVCYNNECVTPDVPPPGAVQLPEVVKKEMGAACNLHSECTTNYCNIQTYTCGVKAVSSDCEKNEECASGICKDGRTCVNTEGGACRSNNDCASGACQTNVCLGAPAGGFGQPCDPTIANSCNTGAGLVCNPASRMCTLSEQPVPVAVVQQPQPDSQACQSHADCGGRGSCIENVCKPVGMRYQQCRPDSMCDTGLVCYNNECVTPDVPPPGAVQLPEVVKKEMGAGCNLHSDCKTNFCNFGKNFVCDVKAVGSDCEKNEECSSGLCQDGRRCVNKENGACRSNNDCASGACQTNVCLGAPAGGFGQPCNPVAAGSCVAPLVCNPNSRMCAQPEAQAPAAEAEPIAPEAPAPEIPVLKQMAAPCQKNNECAAGLVCRGGSDQIGHPELFTCQLVGGSFEGVGVACDEDADCNPQSGHVCLKGACLIPPAAAPPEASACIDSNKLMDYIKQWRADKKREECKGGVAGCIDSNKLMDYIKQWRGDKKRDECKK